MSNEQLDDMLEIGQRLAKYFDHNHRIVFWEDEESEYRDEINLISVENAKIIDATNKELSAKREILRGDAQSNFLIYRAGKPPVPQDDFLLDIKLSAKPFTVNSNGIWAEECGIEPSIADCLDIHAKFFASKERRAALANSTFKKDNLRSVQFAMLISFTKNSYDSARDAFRELVSTVIIEYAQERGNTFKLICDSGLQDAFWDFSSEIIGYTSPGSARASIADLTFAILKRACSELIPNQTYDLTTDALRILNDIKSSKRHSQAYGLILDKYEESLSEQIQEENRTLDCIQSNDTLRIFDKWILVNLVEKLSQDTLNLSSAQKAMELRSAGYWYKEFKNHYEIIIAAIKFNTEIVEFEGCISSKNTAKDIFDAYCDNWYRIDSTYRSVVDSYNKLTNGRFKQSIEAIYKEILATYDNYLIKLTDKWQAALLVTEDEFPPAEIPYQREFFQKNIKPLLPSVEQGRKVAVIISDGLRYEVGVDLANHLVASKDKSLRGLTDINCQGALCMLPSYTQLGMAALLPGDTLIIDKNTGNVSLDNEPTAGVGNRKKILCNAVPGSVAIQASKIIQDGIGDLIKEAPVVYVYHNVIDYVGDKLHTENEVFEACTKANSEIERLVSELISAGCGNVLITSDHGFLYQAGERESYQYAEIPNLAILSNAEGMDMNYTRRFIVADTIPSHDMLIQYSSCKFGLEGEAEIALTKGVTRLRLKGSGAGYVHGGASLQEDIIPIITVTQIKGAKRAHVVEVQGLIQGRTSITGSSVSLDVYQTEPCGPTAMPINIKVGLYAPSGDMLSTKELFMTLDSESEHSEDRRTSTTLDITNDIDNYAEAILRISKQVGDTNSFSTAWEQTYEVNRGFGNDFDF